MEKSTVPILYITKEKIWLMGEDPAYGWNETNLEEILLEIKSKLQGPPAQAGKAVRILIDDNVSYLVNVPTEARLISRSEVLTEIQKLVPEKIESGFWDYKISEHGTINHVQAFVIKRDFLSHLTQGLLAADLQVEASEPLCLSLARLTAFEEAPHIIVFAFSDESYSLILADKGEVISMVCGKGMVSESSITRFIKFSQDNYNIVPLKVILHPDILPQMQSISGVPIAHVDLDPFKGIAKKSDIKGPDEKTLNLDSEKLLKPLILPEAGGEDEIPHRRKRKPIRIIGIMILVAAVAMAVYVLFFQAEVGPSQPSPTPEPQPVVTPAPEVDLSSYKIQIQNGTGVEGEASHVEELLGITEAELGNASSYDYEFTEVKLKPSTGQEVYDKISDKLSVEYNVAKSNQSLTDSSEFDVVIITGKKK